ncbi:S8 family serine peptidase [Myroides sp. LJL119]
MRRFLVFFLFVTNFIYPQDNQMRQWIRQQYTHSDAAGLYADFHNYLQNDKQSIIKAKTNKAMDLLLPRDQGYTLQRVNHDGVAIYYGLNNKHAIEFSGVNYLHNALTANISLLGEKMIIGILDGDVVLDTHVEFTNKNGISRVFLHDPINELPLAQSPEYLQSIHKRNHATHVAGTLVSQGLNAESLGVAPKATLYSYNWKDDIVKIVQLASQGILVSNHSYGIATMSKENTPLIPASYFGVYSREALSYDRVMREYPYYQSVIAAGNDRKDYKILNPSKKGFDMLVGYSVAKNPIVVGAIIPDYRTKTTYISDTDFSNYGPTADFRIKPDIVATGVGLYSSIYQSGDLADKGISNSLYAFSSGTSMSAPVVTGILTLWQQWVLENYNYPFKSSTIKGLMIHTADAIQGNLGPSVKYGWGVINARNGIEFLNNAKGNQAFVVQHTLYDSLDYQTQITVPKDVSALRFTLVWNDLPAEDKIAKALQADKPDLVHDLDLRVIDEHGNQYLPWYINKDYNNPVALQGDNNVDNVERIDIPDAKKGVYTIYVNMKDQALNKVQSFSLLVSDLNFAGLSKTNDQPMDYKFNFDSWPNPASDILYIEIPKEIVFSSKTLQIYNANGQLINVHKIQATDRFELDVSRYVKGMYFLVIKSNAASYRSKFIKR